MFLLRVPEHLRGVKQDSVCETKYKIWMHGNEIVTLVRILRPGREESGLMRRFFKKIKKEGKPIPSWCPKRECSFSLSSARVPEGMQKTADQTRLAKKEE